MLAISGALSSKDVDYDLAEKHINSDRCDPLV